MVRCSNSHCFGASPLPSDHGIYDDYETLLTTSPTTPDLHSIYTDKLRKQCNRFDQQNSGIISSTIIAQVA